MQETLQTEIAHLHSPLCLSSLASAEVFSVHWDVPPLFSVSFNLIQATECHCAERRLKKRWQLPNTHLRKEGRLHWQDLGKNSQNGAGICLLLSLMVCICHFLMVPVPSNPVWRQRSKIVSSSGLQLSYFFLEVELSKAKLAFVTWTTANIFQTVVVCPADGSAPNARSPPSQSEGGENKKNNNKVALGGWGKTIYILYIYVNYIYIESFKLYIYIWM